MKEQIIKLSGVADVDIIRKKALFCINTFVKNANQKIEVAFRNSKSQRTIRQNSLIHGLFNQISINSTHVGTGNYHSPKVWKEYFKDQFLPKEKSIVLGCEVSQVKSTAKLNKTEFSYFVDSILMFCHDNEIEIKISTDDYDFLQDYVK